MALQKVTAIVRPEKLESVEHRLRELGVPGISVTKVKGFGEYLNFYQSDWMCTHVRIEVFTNQDQAEKIAETIIDAAHTGGEGDGIVAILPVESLYHIRSRKQCPKDAC